MVELTGNADASVTPSELADMTSKTQLYNFAQSLGLENLGSLSAIQLAEAIYDALKLPTVEEIVQTNVSDASVANKLIKEVQRSVDQNTVDAVTNQLVEFNDVSDDEARETATEALERDAVKSAVRAAVSSGSISPKVARNIMDDVKSVEQKLATEELPVTRTLDADRIEEILAELRNSEAKVSELAAVQKRVFKLLALTN